MNDPAALEDLATRVGEAGLIGRGSDGVAMLSGGPDSACLTAVAVRLLGPQSVSAVHLNYGLRPEAEEAEEAARALCAKLRIDLHIERPRLPEGNMQARARAARYEAAERLRVKLGAEWIATGHTRTDLAETVLYRLAASPGVRALLGMSERNGRLLRPLLDVSRQTTRTVARGAGLPFADDPSNSDPSFARSRIRAEVVPVLAELGPEIERNVAETQAELREDQGLIRRLAIEEIEAAAADSGAPVRGEDLAEMDPALRRAVLVELAERAAGRSVRVDRSRTAEVIRLAATPEGGLVELGRGLRVVIEGGFVRIRGEAAAAAPEPVRLPIPGSVRFGDWELQAELRQGAVEPRGPELATLDAAELGPEVEIRCWREGDRIRPLGLGGSKSLQDLFTDAGVPRSLRRRLPVLVADERIAWVAGVAVSDEFRLDPSTASSAVITARAVAGAGAD